MFYATIQPVMQSHFQQTSFWCAFKCAHGWSLIEEAGVRFLVRTFRLGPLKASLAYVPMAPIYTAPNGTPKAAEDLSYIRSVGALTQAVRSKLPKNTLCVRYDFPIDFDTVLSRADYAASVYDNATLSDVVIVKADVDVQPPDTVVLALAPSEDELLAAMKSKWRYNIRYASKHGVTVRAVRADDSDFDAALDSFYALYQTTAARDGIGLHPKSYYRDLLEKGSAQNASGDTDKTLVTLYIASHEGEDLAAIITLFNKDEAVYLYGCSGNSKRNLMPAYLVQWTAICDAKKYGCAEYDFYGIPPTGDEGHPMHGLYLFKTGFGGREIHRPGSFDVPLSPLYKLYTAAERARAFWHKKVLKKIRGR